MKKDITKIDYEDDKKVNRKNILIVIIAIIVVIYIGNEIYQLAKNPTNTVLVDKGEISSEESTEGYVLKKEQIIEINRTSDKIEKLKSEGEKVGKGDAIFRYYAANEATLKSKIEELDIEIQASMSNQNNVFSSDIKLLDKAIETKLAAIHNSQSTDEIKTYKRELNSYILKKAKIVGNLSNSGSYINELIKKRTNLENQINSESEIVKAPISGILSYRVDGLENVLNTSDFSYLNKDMLEKLDVKSGEVTGNSGQNAKIIDNFECYLACTLTSKEMKEKKVGNTLKLRLSNATMVDAEIVYLKEEGNATLVVLKVKKEVEYLIDYRKVSFDVVWWSSTGLKVVNSAIKYDEKGLAYVVRNRSGYTTDVLIKVLKYNDDYSIVESYTSSELSELGFQADEIKEIKSLNLYDEILVNP